MRSDGKRVVLYRQRIIHFSIEKGQLGSSVSIVTDYRLGDQGLIPDRGGGFSSTICTQPALRPTQPPVQWALGVLSPGVKCGQGVMLTTHPLPTSAFTACSESTLLSL
jgi:hypothetical protein